MSTPAAKVLPHSRPESAGFSCQSRVDELSDEIGKLAAYINAASCRLLDLIAEFDELGGWHNEGAQSCAHWLNWKCGLSMNAARERVRTALALKALPQMHRYFLEGRISYSKVRAMTRVATPENEEYLVDVAIHHTAAQVERLVRGYRWAIACEEETRRDRERTQHRFCRYGWDSEGCLVVTARLAPEQGAAFIKAISLAEEKGELPGHDIYQEEVNAALSSGVDVPEPTAQRRADALSLLAESFVSGGRASLNGGERYHVMLVADQQVLQQRSASVDRPQRCRVENGPVVSAETLRRLSCDAAITRSVLSIDGEPLSIGRKSRRIPPAIRRALHLRDGRCRFPGCCNTRWVDGHHIKHWADGGETSLHNLVTLCRYHHGLVHEQGFTVRRIGPNNFEFRSPRGNVITEPAPAFLAGKPDLEVEIDGNTGACLWDGKPSDFGAGVEYLQLLDNRSGTPP